MNKGIILIFVTGFLLFLNFPLFANSSPTSRTKIRIVSLEVDLISFQIDIGRPPTQTEGLEILINKPEDPELQKLWKGPYLRKASDLKDSWGNKFIYIHPFQNSKDKYGIYSLGPDGKTASNGNDPDDINSWNSNSGNKGLYSKIWFFTVAVLCVFCFIAIRLVKRNNAKIKQEEKEWTAIHEESGEWKDE